MGALRDEAKFDKEEGIFDDSFAIQPGDVGDCLVGRPCPSVVAVFVLFEDCVDCESVCSDLIHVIEYAVIDSGVGGTSFHS